MRDYKLSARLTLYASRLIFGIMVLLLAVFPCLLELYHMHLRPLPDSGRIITLVGFYSGAVFVLLALWNLDRLLRNILQEALFTMENVHHIRTVGWCCLAVSVISLFAAWVFPSLGFLFLVMIFLALVVTVVEQLFKAAVTLREENDLTV